MRNRQRVRMKHNEVVIVGRLLRRAFVKVDGGGWMWKGGYNDERVALECGVKGITARHVNRLRRAAFGDAPKPSHRSVLAAVVERSKAGAIATVAMATKA